MPDKTLHEVIRKIDGGWYTGSEYPSIFQYNQVWHLMRRFHAASGGAHAVVAVVNVPEWSGGDWAAYAGVSKCETYEQCAMGITTGGAKLSWEDAAYFFPELPIERWRR